MVVHGGAQLHLHTVHLQALCQKNQHGLVLLPTVNRAGYSMLLPTHSRTWAPVPLKDKTAGCKTQSLVLSS